jgi:hypothetical protein
MKKFKINFNAVGLLMFAGWALSGIGALLSQQASDKQTKAYVKELIAEERNAGK